MLTAHQLNRATLEPGNEKGRRMMTREHGLEEAAERKARRLGWVKAGQCGGFVFHSQDFVDWQEATRCGQRVYRTFREALDSDQVAY